ncbi:MAG: hypothetical protein IE909_09400 [Campylobacterales bacterium]|nr:hypothetical protein [Campylobacterales bacterium]
MAKKMILLFSHKLNEKQIKIAKDEYAVEDFVYLSTELQQIWSDISPDIISLEQTLEPIKKYIIRILQKDDIVLIQGDFGATYIMVNFIKELDAIPVYATTRRKIEEIIDEDGKTIKKSIFEFRRFREYE